MIPLTIVIVAFVAAVLIGFSFVMGAPVFGVPIVIVVLLLMGAAHVRRRAERASDVREFRRQAKAEKTEFTERDRQTTVR